MLPAHLTFRQKISLGFRDACGQYTSEDNEGGACEGGGKKEGGDGKVEKDGNRFYVKEHGAGQFVVHDRLRSFKGDPVSGGEVFRNKAQAERKMGQRERRFGEAKDWNKIREQVVGGAARNVPAVPDRERRERAPRADGKPVHGVDPDASSSPLAQGRVVSVENLGGGINTTQRVTLQVPGSGKQDVVFKPEKGETWRTAWGPVRSTVLKADGTMALREQVSFQVDRALGLGLVPETTAIRVEGRAGSAQKFVEKAELGGRASYSNIQAVPMKDWYRMGVLDAVTGNTDRHGGNYMLKKDGGEVRLVAIDHGLTFPRSDGEFSTAALAAGRESKEFTVPSSERRAIVSKIRETNWEKMLERLGEPARAAALARIARVAKAIEEDKLYEFLRPPRRW